jgi:uncharacterized protein (DUF2252 family)
MSTPLTFRERYALGQSHRKQMARASHAKWSAKSNARKADPLDLIAKSMRGRVASLIQIKYNRMACSPFGYFRGAVPVMAYDLSLSANSALFCQLCGDAHVRNLGAFATPDGRLAFDLNDFDETIPGPFEWDVKRMAASLILAGREAETKGSRCREAAEVFLERYRTMIHTLARMPVLEVARYQVHRLGDVAPVAQIMRIAERATPLHNLSTLTIAAKGADPASSELARHTGRSPRIFKTIEPVLTRVSGEQARLVLDALATYAESLLVERRHSLAQYTPLDVAMKVVGTGSVGLRDFCIYMQGNGAKDPLFLQVKEETLSGYAPYLSQPATPTHQGRRVVEGQRAMQLQSDPFLGWTTIEGRDYLVRQLNDHKAAVDMDELKAEGLLEYAGVCGELLARGHARSGDAATIAGYLGNSARFDEAIAAFATAYADQTERDWQELVRSRKAKPPAKAAKASSKVAPASPKKAASPGLSLKY